MGIPQPSLIDGKSSAHGMALCVHKIFEKKVQNHVRMGYVIRVIVTDIFVCLCWIFFRADSVDKALLMIWRMFTFSDGISHVYSWTIVSIVFMAVCHIKVYFKNGKDFCDGYYEIMNLSKLSSLIIWFVVIGLTIGLAYTGASPFIYFQF